MFYFSTRYVKQEDIMDLESSSLMDGGAIEDFQDYATSSSSAQDPTSAAAAAYDYFYTAAAGSSSGSTGKNI